jgi:hypothetical protein
MKHYYLIVDTETTYTKDQEDTVADFGAVVVDRNGKIYDQLGALVAEESHKDFHFALGNKKMIQKKYQDLVAAGKRTTQSVAQINDWLKMVAEKYNPVLTAYNIGFDMGKCRNTGIYLDEFDQRFCLWGASKATICKSPEYAEWVAENMAYTPSGRLSTKADHVAQFLDDTLPPEPHTALEDARDYEAIILYAIIQTPQTRKAIMEIGAGKPSAKWMRSLEDLKNEQ